MLSWVQFVIKLLPYNLNMSFVLLFGVFGVEVDQSTLLHGANYW